MLTLFPKSDPVQTDQVRYVLLPAHQLAWLNRGTAQLTEAEISSALRRADGGTPVPDRCWQLGVSRASFYA